MFYIATNDKEITFENGTVWKNPGFDKWLNAHEGKTLSEARKRIDDLDTLIRCIYEDNILGKLPDARYLKLSAEYEQEQQELKHLADALAREIEAETGQMVDMDKFFVLAEKYADITELTAPLINELIGKILVHSPVKIDGPK